MSLTFNTDDYISTLHELADARKHQAAVEKKIIELDTLREAISKNFDAKYDYLPLCTDVEQFRMELGYLLLDRSKRRHLGGVFDAVQSFKQKFNETIKDARASEENKMKAIIRTMDTTTGDYQFVAALLEIGPEVMFERYAAELGF